MRATDARERGARLLDDPSALQAHIQQCLQAASGRGPAWDRDHPVNGNLSVVMVLLGKHRPRPGRAAEPCLILNKRSRRVKQPGDICCPGGGVMPRFDPFAAHLLRLPLSPLRQWAYFRYWQAHKPRHMERLRLLLATALREGVEEMRLNPFAVRFQGALPAERLVMFGRTIVPLVGWVAGQRRFSPNWEVEKIVRIPLRDLLAPDGYVGLRLRMRETPKTKDDGEWRDFPAFRFPTPEGWEILWGATYRITMSFLDRVFGFQPPHPVGTVVEKRLRPDYLTGKG